MKEEGVLQQQGLAAFRNLPLHRQISRFPVAVAAGKLLSDREDTEDSSRNRALSSTVSPLVLLCHV